MTHEPHKWHKYKGCSYVVCMFCGLMALRNEFTEFCIRKGCDYKEHPDYKKFEKP